MTDYVKVAGHDGLVRDTSSMAIVNTNAGDYERYIAQRNAAQSRQEQLDRHEKDINTIKEDIAEIKALLLSIYQK